MRRKAKSNGKLVCLLRSPFILHEFLARFYSTPQLNLSLTGFHLEPFGGAAIVEKLGSIKGYGYEF